MRCDTKPFLLQHASPAYLSLPVYIRTYLQMYRYMATYCKESFLRYIHCVQYICCIYICICVCTYTYTLAYTYTYTFIYTCTHIHIHIHVHMHMHAYA